MAPQLLERRSQLGTRSSDIAPMCWEVVRRFRLALSSPIASLSIWALMSGYSSNCCPNSLARFETVSHCWLTVLTCCERVGGMTAFASFILRT